MTDRLFNIRNEIDDSISVVESTLIVLEAVLAERENGDRYNWVIIGVLDRLDIIRKDMEEMGNLYSKETSGAQAKSRDPQMEPLATEIINALSATAEAAQSRIDAIRRTAQEIISLCDEHEQEGKERREAANDCKGRIGE